MFLSNPQKIRTIEQCFGLHGTKEYSVGLNYRYVSMSSSAQIESYTNELKGYGIEIEKTIKWFFEQYLYEEFEIDGFKYSIPSPNASDLERTLLVASQFDSVIKQFCMYVEDGIIDRELFEFSSYPRRIVDTPSLIDNKYIYSNSTKIERITFYLFSDQCLLSYTEKTKSKYSTLSELLINENVQLADYFVGHQNELKWLIENKAIAIDDFGYLKIPSLPYRLLYDLNNNGSIVYPYCTNEEKRLIDEMMSRCELVAEKTLFTRQEQQYLDYMLNAKSFDNGPEIRNKYVHGSFSLDHSINHRDYIDLLKIMILIVIKTNEEFCLKFPE